MKPDKQRIAIAEYCDTDIYIDDVLSERLPDYPNDLNAMHKAENHLPMELQDTYMEHLLDITGVKGWGICHALAEDRAEAFLKTIGKWEE